MKNFFYWPTKVASPALELDITVHVDDLLVSGSRSWRDWIHRELEAKFGPVKRNGLPFTHTGVEHVRLGNACIHLHQQPYLEGIKKIELDKQRSKERTSPCQPHEEH